jgi:hypothetical protein
MVTRPPKLIPDDVKLLLQSLVGQSCTLQRINRDRSLFIGFGEVEETSSKPHATTEIGIYDCSWRISSNGKIVCGKDDAVDELADLQECFNRINLGEFVALSQITEFDIRIQFSTSINLDILCTTSDDDEAFHIFFPSKVVLTFNPDEGWRLGRSDKPWS